MRTSLAVFAAAVPVLAVTASLSGLAQAPKAGAKPAPAAATQEQQVTPPESRYWMGATTGSGMLAMSGMAGGGRPSMGSLMKMATSGLPSAGHMIELRLGTTLAPTGEPEAFHTFPAGAQVNKPIYLETPQPGKSESGTAAYKAPKGQITFYWGCGEKAGPGQPVILTFDKLMRGENDPELQALAASVSARGVRTPTVTNSKTYGDWPNADRRKRNKDLEATFPVGSTLAGQHVIEGTYTPKIDFALPDDKTYMEPVRYSKTAVLPSGAVALSWNGQARATGYSLGVMAPEKVDDESANIVMWSSAERPATFVQMEHLTPAEVKRLIDLKAVLPPTTTDCAVPAEVVKATRNGSMLMFTAYGDEATFIHPARPADPKVTWDQEWFARVSFKAARMDMISPEGVMDMTAMSGGSEAGKGKPDPSLSDEEYCAALAKQEAEKPSVADAIPGGRLLGRFGRKKETPPPSDPRCANLKKK
ncbi:hypothetical protein TBR22_A10820 [Luteitalea sp. TBR-22]|uniref:hypothetical protein n=1 Tax=Luteitalea sp. TBR-22 TaxID=2802971 RepID=UPI001AF195AC|nr:hypothetical protein [Luteitalea sp. TBR-22]BCS31879.1 hypothetical protein TBR22_A10820 [Luteitalea sp. TBR-22]